jgi:hydrogenase expression/formation protein HypE
MNDTARIVLGHGSGGTLTHQLLAKSIFPLFDNPILAQADDAAVFSLKGATALTTDSFVVQPLFFPGGDIGKLAVCGTVNDLAMMGAAPLYLTAACIIEEGFEISLLEKIIRSMSRAAREAGVTIAGGDLKVVEQGAADGIFINTSGVGSIARGRAVSGHGARPGDLVIINGHIGEHGTAVMAARQNYKLTTAVKSDCACLNGLVDAVLRAGPRVHAMRDPTRGGVATTLNEIALQSGVQIEIDEEQLPVTPAVRGFSEILGIDPLYLANEGKMLLFADPRSAAAALAAMRGHPLGKQARIIGRVTGKGEPLVALRTAIGSTRILSMLAGEQLPRIC